MNSIPERIRLFEDGTVTIFLNSYTLGLSVSYKIPEYEIALDCIKDIVEENFPELTDLIIGSPPNSIPDFSDIWDAIQRDKFDAILGDIKIDL